MITKKLISYGACDPAIVWCGKKSWKTIYETCPNPLWILWLYKRTNKDDDRGLASAKAAVASFFLDYLENDSFKILLEVTVRYGEGMPYKKFREFQDIAYLTVGHELNYYERLVFLSGNPQAIGTFFRVAKQAFHFWSPTITDEASDRILLRIIKKALPFKKWKIKDDKKTTRRGKK